ncbi:MAG: hypothetical protein F4169_20505 [Gammaproteobacteria bacterium]|nr:hypothetical protein [Gammaproteobacteria bacterium]
MNLPDIIKRLEDIGTQVAGINAAAEDVASRIGSDPNLKPLEADILNMGRAAEKIGADLKAIIKDL